MALADSVHALALEVYAKRPAGVAPTAWLTDSTGVPAHRVAAQLVKQAAVLEGRVAREQLVLRRDPLVLARVLQGDLRVRGEVGEQRVVLVGEAVVDPLAVGVEAVDRLDDGDDLPLRDAYAASPRSIGTRIGSAWESGPSSNL